MTATFLFTDLVDSTAIASRLGPTVAEELRQSHFGILRTAAEATGGMEIKTTGDGLMLMFTGPSRALSCAVAIQQAIERHNQRGGELLAIRIGVSMGEATEDDGDFYGDCVVEAARLCAAANGGQIFTTELLRAVIGRHAAQDFAPVGDLELKGLPDPVPTVEVLWTAEAAPGSVPLPGRFVGPASEGLFGFFGRGDEVALLTAAAKRATAERHTEVVFVAGEPGIGKTTLGAYVSRTLHASGAIVLFGHCVEDLGVPYQPWVEALSHLVQRAPENLIAECLEHHGSALARLVPSLAGRYATSEPSDNAEGERFVMLEAVTDLLRTASVDAPLVLLLDDVHWADVASLQMLRHVMSGSPAPSMLVIATYRDSDITRDDPLTAFLADMRREPMVSRVSLRGLDDEEILALMEGAAGYEMPEAGVALAHAVYRETDGNPFFTGEMLRHLYETGAIAFDESGESGQYGLTIDLDEVGLPGSVLEVVRRRVDRLGEEATRVLTIASVFGREFDLEPVAAVADVDDDTLLDLLEVAAGAALVVERRDVPGRFRFEHALIQHTLYQDLSATRRQRLHHRAAQALEERADAHRIPVEELARHWIAATRPAEVGKAIEYASLAGEAALSALAPIDAVRWYTQALELSQRDGADDPAARCDLLIGLGHSQRLAGLVEHRETLLQAADLALELGDVDRLVRSALANTRGTQSMAADDDRVRVLDAALARVERESATGAQLLAALANETDPADWERVRDYAFEAVEVARRVSDDETLLSVLTATLVSRSQPDRLDGRRADAEEAMALADRLGDAVAGFQARYELAVSLTVAGDIDEADALTDDLLARSQSIGYPFMRWQVDIDLVARALRLTQLDEAEVMANAALELGLRAGVVEAFGVYGAHLHDIRWYQGRRDEIAEMVIAASVENPGIPSLRTAVIDICCEIGDYEQARRRLAHEVALGFDYEFNLQWLNTMQGAANAAATLGDVEAAEILYALVSPYAANLAFAHGTAPRPVSRWLGRLATLLGRHDEAERHLTLALEISERIRSPYDIASTLLDHAELCLARNAPGDRDRARNLAERALDLARGFGGRRLVMQADAILAELTS